MSVESPPQSCPRCEAAVAADARFCANCGQALGEPSTTDAAIHSRLAAAAPNPLVTKMRAARLTGERKPVTALFADVVGSTTLAEQIDPEDWTALINEAFDLMSRAVFRYEGTIAQLQGDAMVAFFGAPVAHEDDPERAILAALDMIAATDEFAAQLKATQGIDFRIRAGINSGPVMVGNVGSDLRFEYTALGDAMNVAARMQTAAQPGTIIITEMTRRLTGDTFDLDDLGDIEVKGKTEPIHAYRIVGRKAAPARRRGLESVGLDSPMVGRAEQLQRLTSLLDVVAAGRGRAAFIIGEPGIGKSRLLAECRRLATAGQRAISYAEGQCLSYGHNLPHHLIVDLVRSIIGVTPTSGDRETHAALRGHADRHLYGPEGSEVFTYLEHLLSLKQDPSTASRLETMDPAGLQTHYVESLRRLIAAEAAATPLLLACEDVHWADPSSVQILERLLTELGPRHSVLWLLTLRPQVSADTDALLAVARASYGEAARELVLDPLSSEDSRRLVANLLEIESLTEPVRELIYEKSDGNPFFVEEVMRMLIEQGAIERQDGRWSETRAIDDVQIPDNLHSLLVARIDALPPEARHTLLVASVIGRRFAASVLNGVLATAAER
jgi:class 3 adenylate cyclase